MTVARQTIPYARPSITDLEKKYVDDALINGWGEHCYDYIIRFEEAFRTYLGVKHAIATSSCTGALHMGLHALGIGSGDEVIMADSNWVATAAPIVHLGATPVFVDILPDSWCLDPVQVEAAITPKTRAIIAVHLYGNLCEMNELLAIGERHGIPIVEDAAEAIGSVYHGKRAGSMGAFGVFSFHGTKTITTGEGGMFVTNDSNLFENVLTLSNHGRSKKQIKQFWPERVGYKYKMSNVQAALGVAQLERINSLLDIKRTTFKMYESHLVDLPLLMNPEPSGCTNGFWMPTVVVNEDIRFDRDNLVSIFKMNDIDARVFFWPLSTTGLMGRKALDKTYLSENIHLRSINLPSPLNMSALDIQKVSDIVDLAIKSRGRKPAGLKERL
jgi:perosamine synthetase